MEHTKTLSFPEIEFRIVFEVKPEHKLNPGAAFYYKIFCEPNTNTSEKKIDRMVEKYYLKILGEFHHDVFAHTSHRLHWGESKEEKEYTRKGEKVVRLLLTYTIITLPREVRDKMISDQVKEEMKWFRP